MDYDERNELHGLRARERAASFARTEFMRITLDEQRRLTEDFAARMDSVIKGAGTRQRRLADDFTNDARDAVRRIAAAAAEDAERRTGLFRTLIPVSCFAGARPSPRSFMVLGPDRGAEMMISMSAAAESVPASPGPAPESFLPVPLDFPGAPEPTERPADADPETAGPRTGPGGRRDGRRAERGAAKGGGRREAPAKPAGQPSAPDRRRKSRRPRE